MLVYIVVFVCTSAWMCCVLWCAAPLTDVPSFPSALVSCFARLLCNTGLLCSPLALLCSVSTCPLSVLVWIPSFELDPFRCGPGPARLSSAREQGGGWTLGPANIRALTAFSLSRLSLWKSPLFYLVFLLWQSLLLHLVRLLNNFYVQGQSGHLTFYGKNELGWNKGLFFCVCGKMCTPGLKMWAGGACVDRRWERVIVRR